MNAKGFWSEVYQSILEDDFCTMMFCIIIFLVSIILISTTKIPTPERIKYAISYVIQTPTLTPPDQAVRNIVNSYSHKRVEYRGASITYPIGLFPEEKLEVFYTVVDSLTDDVYPEYSIKNIPMSVYVDESYETLCQDPEYWINSTETDCKSIEGVAGSFYMSILLMPDTFNGVKNNGDLAMILVHEYLHIVQYTYPEILTQYEKNIGWTEPQENRNEDFYSVLSDYSLKKSSEDMSETFKFAYLCGNDLGRLSQERLNEALSFWSVPREEFCRNFN